MWVRSPEMMMGGYWDAWRGRHKQASKEGEEVSVVLKQDFEDDVEVEQILNEWMVMVSAQSTSTKHPTIPMHIPTTPVPPKQLHAHCALDAARFKVSLRRCLQLLLAPRPGPRLHPLVYFPCMVRGIGTLHFRPHAQAAPLTFLLGKLCVFKGFGPLKSCDLDAFSTTLLKQQMSRIATPPSVPVHYGS